MERNGRKEVPLVCDGASFMDFKNVLYSLTPSWRNMKAFSSAMHCEENLRSQFSIATVDRKSRTSYCDLKIPSQHAWR